MASAAQVGPNPNWRSMLVLIGGIVGSLAFYVGLAALIAWD